MVVAAASVDVCASFFSLLPLAGLRPCSRLNAVQGTANQHKGVLLIKPPLSPQTMVTTVEIPSRRDIHRISGHQTELYGLRTHPWWRTDSRHIHTAGPVSQVVLAALTVSTATRRGSQQTRLGRR